MKDEPFELWQQVLRKVFQVYGFRALAILSLAIVCVLTGGYLYVPPFNSLLLVFISVSFAGGLVFLSGPVINELALNVVDKTVGYGCIALAGVLTGSGLIIVLAHAGVYQSEEIAAKQVAQRLAALEGDLENKALFLEAKTDLTELTIEHVGYSYKDGVMFGCATRLDDSYKDPWVCVSTKDLDGPVISVPDAEVVKLK